MRSLTLLYSSLILSLALALAQPVFALRQPIPRFCIQSVNVLTHPVRSITKGIPNLVHLASKEIQMRMDSLGENEAELFNLGAGRSILILPDAAFAVGPHLDKDKRQLNGGLEFRKLNLENRLRPQLKTGKTRLLRRLISKFIPVRGGLRMKFSPESFQALQLPFTEQNFELGFGSETLIPSRYYKDSGELLTFQNGLKDFFKENAEPIESSAKAKPRIFSRRALAAASIAWAAALTIPNPILWAPLVWKEHSSFLDKDVGPATALLMHPLDRYWDRLNTSRLDQLLPFLDYMNGDPTKLLTEVNGKKIPMTNDPIESLSSFEPRIVELKIPKFDIHPALMQKMNSNMSRSEILDSRLHELRFSLNSTDRLEKFVTTLLRTAADPVPNSNLRSFGTRWASGKREPFLVMNNEVLSPLLPFHKEDKRFNLPVTIVPYIFTQPAVKQNPRWKAWAVKLGSKKIPIINRTGWPDASLEIPTYWVPQFILNEALDNLTEAEAKELTPEILELIEDPEMTYMGTNAAIKYKIKEAIPLAIRSLEDLFIGYANWEPVLSDMAQKDRDHDKIIRRNSIIDPIWSRYTNIGAYTELLTEMPTEESKTFLLHHSTQLVHFATTRGRAEILSKLLAIQEPKNRDILINSVLQQLLSIPEISNPDRIAQEQINLEQDSGRILFALLPYISTEAKINRDFYSAAEKCLRGRSNESKVWTVLAFQKMNSREAIDILLDDLDRLANNRRLPTDSFDETYRHITRAIFSSIYFSSDDLRRIRRMRDHLESLSTKKPRTGNDWNEIYYHSKIFQDLDKKLKEFEAANPGR